MIIVADSSALVALATCDALHLLDALFEVVRVPQKVFDECIVENKLQAEKLAIYLQDKILPITPTNTLQLPSNLGQGEIEAMTLYLQTQADYLLIDDNRARKVAELNQINIIDSLGLLVIAKNKGAISSISPFLDILANSLLYINPTLLAQVKVMAGE
jgi:uncharacterized protein